MLARQRLNDLKCLKQHLLEAVALARSYNLERLRAQAMIEIVCIRGMRIRDLAKQKRSLTTIETGSTPNTSPQQTPSGPPASMEYARVHKGEST